VADERPQYQHGTGTIGGQTFHWGSGQPGAYWSIPYGDYPVTPDAPTGDWAHRVGAIPIANNVIPDPQLGRDRIGIMIHSGSAPDLDTLYTQGCFKVAPSEWPSVRAEILKEAKSGPLYLHVAAGGQAAFTNTPTLSKAGSETPASNANAAANTTASPSGTTINSPNAPVPGALANQGPESVGSSGPAAASSGPLDVRQLVYNKLTGAGLASHQALGAVWSLAGESGAGLNPGAYNPKDPGGSVGIGQWLGPRRAALEAFAKDRGTAVTDPNTQADFLVDELTNEKAATYQPGVFKAMQGAQTAADATKVWTSQFERPKVDNSDARIKNGTQVASLDDKGNFVLGQGGSATTAPAVATTATPTDQGWWSKLTTAPTDAEGKPIAGAKSPLQELTQGALSKLGSEGQTEKDEAPARSALESAGPGARNVSPGLANVQQTYGNTLNSFLQPLTWNSRAAGPPGMPAAGLQQAPATQVPGMSLTSVPSNLGYGIDTNLGYGFG
jgi:hypothetical protein